MQKIITITGDGSPTLYVPELKEHYHSTFGAIQESVFVYIERAFNKCYKQEINLYEIGFGSGLNAYLTCLEAVKTKKNISYHSVELYPLEKALWQEIGKYFVENPQNEQLFCAIHECEWGQEVKINSNFRLKKIKADITAYMPTDLYDVIYFDAFRPDIQPELWTAEVFTGIYNIMNPGAHLSTYSSKGQVRRNMKLAGLTVNVTPGPPGKREMIIASKPFQVAS